MSSPGGSGEQLGALRVLVHAMILFFRCLRLASPICKLMLASLHIEKRAICRHGTTKLISCGGRCPTRQLVE